MWPDLAIIAQLSAPSRADKGCPPSPAPCPQGSEQGDCGSERHVVWLLAHERVSQRGCKMHRNCRCWSPKCWEAHEQWLDVPLRHLCLSALVRVREQAGRPDAELAPRPAAAGAPIISASSPTAVRCAACRAARSKDSVPRRVWRTQRADRWPDQCTQRAHRFGKPTEGVPGGGQQSSTMLHGPGFCETAMLDLSVLTAT
jgi:hypothetical protein